MTRLQPYLSFNGNCREAMQFYKSCIGGRLRFQTVGESPLAEGLPQKMKACILHATLNKGPLVLMGTDLLGEKGRVIGNTVALALVCNSEKELYRAYKKLAAGGRALQQPESTFFGSLVGSLCDRYGNNWLLQYDSKCNAS